MIPTIETIVEDLIAGTITKQQAIAWLYLHAEGMANDLRDHFAAQVIPVLMQTSNNSTSMDNDADLAYKMADAMMVARGKNSG